MSEPIIPLFPGTCRKPGKKTKDIVLTPKQIAWLRRWFPVCQSGIICKTMGISHTSLFRICHRLDIHKSDEIRVKIWSDSAKKGMRTCRENGYYASLKGTPVSKKCRDANNAWWKKVQSGELPSPTEIFRQNHPEEAKRMFAESGKKLSRHYKMEKLLLLSGEKTETRLRIVIRPFTKSQIAHRRNALKRGYFFFEDVSGHDKDRYNIYYDKDTKRAPVFERNLRKDGFTVLDGEGL